MSGVVEGHCGDVACVSFADNPCRRRGVREGHGEDRWWRSARHGVRITDDRGGAWRGGAKEACIRFADIPQIARMAK